MLGRRLLSRLASVSTSARPAAAAVRCASEWLQGRPPSAADLKPDTLAAFYYQNVREYDLPAKDFVVAVGQEERFNVGQFDKEVYSFATGFAEGLGLKQGTKLAVWMTNELEHLAVQCAAALTGATVLSIDPRLPWDAVLAIFKEEDPRAFILSPRFGGEDRAGALAAQFDAELGPLSTRWGYETLRSKRFRGLKFIAQSGFEEVPGVVSLSDLHVLGSEGAYEMDRVAAMQHAVAASDAVTVQYSRAGAGSTGLDRKVISHSQTLATAGAAAAALGLKATDTLVLTAPLFSHFGYAGGALAAMRAHAKTVIPSRQFDAAAALKAITSQRATHLVATPEQVSEMASVLAQDAKKDFSTASLRGGLVLAEGGAPTASLPGVTLKAIDAAKLPSKAAWA